MLNKKQKQELVQNIEDKIKTAKSVVFADYKGLKMSDLKELRSKLKGVKGVFKVVKKTLIDLALKKADVGDASAKKMQGQIALAFSDQDEVAAAKIISDFSKKNENLKILGAILEGKFLDEAGAKSLAKIPGREQLLANLVGSIASPISGFVSVLQGNLRGLVFVLSRIKK
ncbi:MAG: 50S ribosomal protein L10 [Candidatus Portnoybacteria bacterium]|nr:50S ribosomal protein L10 [Candidatus Portnoybacteria bacterium]